MVFGILGSVTVDTNVPPLVTGSPSDHVPVSNSTSVVSTPLYIKREPSGEEQHKALLHGILSHHHHSSQVAAAAALLGYTGTTTATTTTGKIVYTPMLVSTTHSHIYYYVRSMLTTLRR